MEFTEGMLPVGFIFEANVRANYEVGEAIVYANVGDIRIGDILILLIRDP